jgi:hypothetical protein
MLDSYKGYVTRLRKDNNIKDIDSEYSLARKLNLPVEVISTLVPKDRLKTGMAGKFISDIMRKKM